MPASTSPRRTASRPIAPRSIVLLACVLASSACGDGTPPWQGEAPVRWRELDVRGEGSGFIAMEARRTRLDFVNDPADDLISANQHLANGAGVAIGDVDGDGRPDVFLTHTRGENRLYRNLGGMRFEDVSDAAGVRMPDRHPTGSAFADLDGDGDLDLAVASMGAPLALLFNDGSGRFSDRSAESGLTAVRAGSTLALADIDGDGDLDLYATNYRLRRAADVFSPDDRRATPVLDQRDGVWVVNEQYRDYYRALMGPDGPMSWEFGEADDLYVNDGTGRFVREPVLGPRFRHADGTPVAVEPEEWGLAARFRDVNGDGAPDLYVANDFESPDQLWLGDGRGGFRAVGSPGLRKTSSASMSIAFGDVDRDGTTDVFVADMLSRSSLLRKTQMSTLHERRPPTGVVDSTMQVNRNTLLLGHSDGSWAEAAQWAGVEATGWSWASELLDVDLDGALDLLVVNGHRWNPLDADTGDRLRRTQATAGADWHEVINLFPELRLSNEALRNRGNGTFEPVAGGWGLDAGPDVSHGMAAGDLDGDGDLDLVVNRLGDPALVLRNGAAAPRVAVRLRGRAPNTAGVGARVTVSHPDGDQLGEVGAGGLYLSHSDALQVFAAAGSPIRISVRWPSGGVTVVPGTAANRLYEITETGDEAPGSGTTARAPESSAPDGTLFEDARAELGHLHRDADFHDALRQPLLPRELSRLGPGVTWTDADGDGWSDLVVGSGTGGAPVLFPNADGRLARGRSLGGTLAHDATTLLPLDAPGPTRLLVGLSNYEAASPREARQAPAALWLPLGGQPGSGRPALSSDGAATGALASADVDGDGWLDVLLAGRVYATAYPLPPPTRLFRGTPGGAFELDSVASEVLASAGLVSAATFTDVDGDGDPDLALGVEWGPVRLFLNEGGRLIDVTEAWGLARHTSWWNGVTAGDLDGDGRMDLVATSWGGNTGLHPQDTAPLRGYWGDFDRNGVLDFVLAQRDPRTGEIAPLESLVRLSRGLPYVRMQRTPTFAAYADASVAEVLGPAVEVAEVVEATTLEHTVFLNRGRAFEPHPLPAGAQLAPAFGVAVADFDGDGHEDVLLAQNFFGNMLGAERFDTGRGLWLRGDGTGRLSAVGAERSGVAVHGDQRGLAVADFDRDGRADAVIGQNAGPTVLLRNRGAAPGVRVRVVAGPGNPHGIGAVVRLRYAGDAGPAREIRAGSGYWSVDDPVVVLGVSGEPEALEVRFPGGETRTVPLGPGQREVSVRRSP